MGRKDFLTLVFMTEELIDFGGVSVVDDAQSKKRQGEFNFGVGTQEN